MAEEVLGERGHKLLAAIVVMDAAGEPHLLQIGLETEEVLRRAVSFVVAQHRLQRLADDEVVASELVKGDVASVERGLGETVDIEFLLERECLKTQERVAEHLDVSKSLVVIDELFCHDYLFLWVTYHPWMRK